MTDDRPITEDDLQAYVDRALEAGRAAAVENYLAAHPDVANRIRGYAEQRGALRSALAPVAEEPLPPELNIARMIEARRRPVFATWRAAAAAVVLLTMGGAVGWVLRDESAPAAGGIAALAREAENSYAVYGQDRVRPVELRSDASDELVHWISQRLDHPIAVPDLSSSGYRFMGGRLVATPHGPAGLLMYDDDHGTRLVMLMRPMEADRDAPMSQHIADGIAGFTWAENGFGYSLVGPAAPDVLHPLADEVRRQIRA